LGSLQDVFNLLPNLGTAPTKKGGSSSQFSEDNSELARAMSIKTNDQLMAIYLSSLIRAITAFHDLIENKVQNKHQQEDKDAGLGEKEKDGEKEKTEEKANGQKDEDAKSNGVNGDAKSPDPKNGSTGKNTKSSK
jgi:26S proteasome regulatory subunit N8